MTDEHKKEYFMKLSKKRKKDKKKKEENEQILAKEKIKVEQSFYTNKKTSMNV